MIIRVKRWQWAVLLCVVLPLMGFAAGTLLGVQMTLKERDVTARTMAQVQQEDRGPTATLPNGTEVSLDELAPQRPTAIVVMKDPHCRVCQRQLSALSHRLGKVQQAGGAVFGLSRADGATNRRLMRGLGLKFPVLSDEDGDLLKTFGMLSADGRHVMPGVIFVGEDGRVESVYKGRRPGQPQEAMILQRLAH